MGRLDIRSVVSLFKPREVRIGYDIPMRHTLRAKVPEPPVAMGHADTKTRLLAYFGSSGLSLCQIEKSYGRTNLEFCSILGRRERLKVATILKVALE